MVINLTPDKNHCAVVEAVIPLMQKGATLSYSHGFNIVEEGMKIREDLTVIMVAPKCPGSEVREEYKRGFGVPTLIAVHPENDPKGQGLEWAKSLCLCYRRSSCRGIGILFRGRSKIRFDGRTNHSLWGSSNRFYLEF